MNFEWDEAKNASNYAKHGIRFEEAVRIFTEPVVTSIDTREDYGEVREISIGRLYNVVCITVVHTDRDGVLRVISARRANRSERKKFDDYYQKITR